jgi:hypothetical protein
MVTISVITFVLTLVGGYLFDRSTADSRVKDEKDAEQSLDQAEQPFTAAAMYDESGIDNWKLALDRPLTAAEQNKLTSLRPSADGDFTEAWRYLRSLGGRILRYPSLLNAGPPEGYGSLGAESTIFKLNLFSNRDSNLSIVDMRPSDVTCHEPSAKTVVAFPPQGGAAYEGILYNLMDKDFGPIITDEGDDQGQPYFSRRKIDLGNGESPGGLRVEALVRAKTCEWKIQATYQDAYGGSEKHVVTIQNGKKPFVAEAVPDDPDQLFLYDAGAAHGPGWVDCDKVTDNASCVAWRKGER